MFFKKNDLIVFSVGVLFIYLSLIYLYLPLINIEPMFIRDFTCILFGSLVLFAVKKYLLDKLGKIEEESI